MSTDALKIYVLCALLRHGDKRILKNFALNNQGFSVNLIAPTIDDILCVNGFR